MIRDYRIRVDVIRNGARVTSLKEVGPPTVDCDAEAIIKTSMTGVFEDDPKVNWLTDEIEPFQIINGIEYPVGIFPVGTKTDYTNENGLKTVQIECYDRGKYLNEKKTEKIINFPKGEKYISVIETLLLDAGIELYMTEQTAEVLATDREDWDVGTSYIEIINQLLDEINYMQVWFDEKGIARLQPRREPNAKNIDHQYGEKDNVKVLHRKATKTLDVFNAPNVFFLICDNPDFPEPLIAKAENNNPMSDLSTVKRGRRILEKRNVDNVPNMQSLQKMADRVAVESMMASEIVTITTSNVPGHKVMDNVAIMHPEIKGIYQETGWHLIMQAGEQMIHNLRRSIIV